MRNKLCSVLEYLNGFLFTAGLGALLALVMHLTAGYELPSQLLLFSGALLPFYLLLLLADRAARGFLLFFLMAAAGFAASFLLPAEIAPRVLILLVYVILTAIFIDSRVREKTNPLFRVKVFPIAFFAALYLLSSAAKSRDVTLIRRISYGLTFASAILFVIHRNLSNLSQYLENNRFVQNIPTRQIGRTNTGSLLLYLLVMVVLMLLLPMTDLGSLILSVGKLLKNLLIFLLRLIHFRSSEDSSYVSESAPASDGGDLGLGAAETGPEWLTALYSILGYVFGALVFLLILAGLIIAVVRMIRRFYRSAGENGDVQEFIAAREETKVSVLPSLKELLKRPDWLDFSPNALVRRAFRKSILKGSRERPAPSLTPRELESFAGLPESPENALLHELYEKARYTESGVTKEEALLLKGRS